MAIYYLDLVSGNDGYNGTAPTSPKLTLSAATWLCQNAGDEIHVKFNVSPSKQYGCNNRGPSNWTNNTSTVTCSTDYTGIIKAGAYIWKATDIIPEMYKVASTNWDSGTSTFTMTLTFLVDNYQGATETVDFFTLNNLGSTSTNEYFSKDAPYSGSTTDWTARTGCTIIGGYDLANMYGGGADQIVGFTYWLNSGVIAITSNSKKYWGLKNMIFNQPTKQVCLMYNGTVENCSVIQTTGGFGVFNYSYMNNCSLSSLATNSWTVIPLSSYIINTEFHNATSPVYGAGNTSISGCSFKNLYYANNTAYYTTVSDSVIKKCNTFSLSSRSNYYYNNIINNTTLASSGYFNVFRNNTLTGTTVSSDDESVFINTPVTLGGLGKKITLINSTNTYSLPTAKLFNITSADSYLYDGMNNYKANIICPDASYNAVLYDNCAVQTTGVTNSGTTSLKVTQYLNTAGAKAGLVEFFVTSGTSYNSSFWVMSSTGQTVEYMYYLNEVPLSTTWLSGTTSTSTWTNYTYTVPAVSSSGVLKLYVRFLSVSGSWIYVNYISLTPV